MAYTDNIIPVMTSATAPSGVASSGGNYDGTTPPWRAFDHVVAGTGAPLWLAPAGETGWLQYQFPVGRTVTCYAITTRSMSGPAMAPKTWTFKGSNDGADWTTLDTQTNITSWATTLGARLVFTFANTTAYAYYRLDISASNTEGYLAVGELEMMETLAVPIQSGRFPVLSRVCRGMN